MLNKSKISSRQFMILTTFFTFGSAILTVPSGIVALAQQDAWIAALIGLAIGIVLIGMYILLAKQHPNKSLVEMMDVLMGKWLGRLIALLFVVSYFLLGPCAVLSILGNFLTTQMMPETPMVSLNILITAVVIMGGYLGIEVLARSSELIIPWGALLFFAFIVLVSFDIKPLNLQPVLENGIAPLGPAVLSFLGTVFLPNIILLMIIPHVNNEDNEAGRALLIGSIIGCVVMIIIIIMTIMVFGPGFTARSMYPTYSLARKISIGNFLQRIEAIIATIWFISLYFRVTIYVYVLSVALAQIFNLKDYRPLLMPLGMLLVVLSQFIYPNIPYEQESDARTWVPFTIIFGLFLPLLLLCLRGFRNMNKN
ncbi:spore germination protein [Paenibacillus oenotherae]|uniref:Spore germination protein n=1 Tax=Paenibacillus oenotherae TaxID=1435645 RepID=A0ABS7D317_9BACL|nr:endospore germination permease [Paenibacillus oenotherae]MBW7474256.1 spore germination protein [Paenibacillus oenotherae]